MENQNLLYPVCSLAFIECSKLYAGHIYNTCKVTCTSHAGHMYTTCRSHLQHMQGHMYITCRSHVGRVHHMQVTCRSRTSLYLVCSLVFIEGSKLYHLVPGVSTLDFGDRSSDSLSTDSFSAFNIARMSKEEGQHCFM